MSPHRSDKLYLPLSKWNPVIFFGLTCAPLACATAAGSLVSGRGEHFSATFDTDLDLSILFLWLFRGVGSIPRYLGQLYLDSTISLALLWVLKRKKEEEKKNHSVSQTNVVLFVISVSAFQ